ncbi:hypothetical protein Bca52824_080589 [Brassica carinata]|uniref:DUF1985 domain-containing protein n=1 Tax=Brassica carinata TaxID=52824 RepID=A0A8X7PGC5_BRACI|nr:hypothetical protein Bca52824_080589 [Brassica carinata]
MDSIPEIMFAAGEEPVGVRVLTYQSSRAIKKIIKGLDEEEILSIRASSFGKIIDIGEKPLFSGRFTRYMMSRQLKVKKKHEVWFRFAGQPIRFSLREFAIVTGLPCESESADDVEEGSERSSKKQTLSPAHARNLDKKTEVYVKSIIDEDPTRPLDESTLGWYDEVEDVGVDNLVKLINQGYKFCASMFKGGATKADVQRMREDAKERAKEKKSRKAPVNPSTVDGGNCEAAAGLMDMIKPDLMRIDGNVSSTMRAVNDMITKIGVWHGAIKTEVGEWMGIIKEEIQGQISLALKEAEGTSTHPPAVPIFYRNTIRNVMGSIEQYKTPLRQNIQVQEVGVADGRQNVGAEANVTVDPQNDGTALSASSHTHMRKDGVNEINVPDNETKEQVPEAPSFSLGLTQQEKSPCNEQLGAVRLAADLNVGHDEGEENKETKKFPSNLMADYECGHNIVGHGRQAHVLLLVSPDSEVTITKFQQLGEKLLSSL